MYETINIDESLKLQQLQTDAAAELFHLTDQNRDYLGKWLPWVKTTQTVEDSADFIKLMLVERQAANQYGYGIFYNDVLVGHMGLMHLKDIEKAPEIGYWVTQKVAGQGIMTKAVVALTNFGKQQLKLENIVIHAHPDNGASNRVAEKVGYTLTGQTFDEIQQTVLNVWLI